MSPNVTNCLQNVSKMSPKMSPKCLHNVSKCLQNVSKMSPKCLQMSIETFSPFHFFQFLQFTVA